jgi:hypothetical protein
VLLLFLAPSSFCFGEFGGPYQYGESDFVFLQVAATRTSISRWLKSEGPYNSKTRDIRADNQVNDRDAFKWKFFSTLGDGNPNRADPKAGQCVKYGDIVYINAFGRDGLLVTVEGTLWDSLNGDGSVDVFNPDNPDTMDVAEPGYQWQIRSNPGIGLLEEDESDTSDPAFGLCIGDRDPVYFQSRLRENRWLNGARGGNNANVLTGNQNTDSAKDTYVWIVRKSQTSLPGQDPPMRCAVRNVTRGYWQDTISSNGETELTQTIQIRRTEEFESTRTQDWSVGVEATISGGFPFGGAESSVTVSSSFSRGLSTTARQISEFTESQTIRRTFPPGQLWQFVFEMRDVCVPQWEIATEHIVVTDNVLEPPCCLPGAFADLENAHGPCVGDSPCTCSDDICNRSPSGTPPDDVPPDEAGNSPACFSGFNKVEVKGKGMVRMDELEVGDLVRSDRNSGRYSRLHSFLHKNPNVETTFLQIHANRLEMPLEVTQDHLVFVWDNHQDKAGPFGITT